MGLRTKRPNYSLKSLTRGLPRKTVPKTTLEARSIYCCSTTNECFYSPKCGGGEWDHCRDVIQDYHTGIFYYDCGSERKAINIIAFVKRIERKLKLSKKRRAAICRTDKPKIIYVKLSGWWRTDLRRSVFTALLRAGKNYRPGWDNWYATLMSSHYFKPTKPAINRFLDGHTKLKLPERNPSDYWCSDSYFEGWTDYFRDKKQDEVEDCLVKGRT